MSNYIDHATKDGVEIPFRDTDSGYATEEYVDSIVGDIETVLNDINSGDGGKE